MKKIIACLFLLIFICFGFVSNGWSQRLGYPALGTWEDYNSYGQSYSFYINKDGGSDNQGFSVKEYVSENPVFQVNTDGQITFGSQNTNKSASLAFMQGAVGYGEINTSSQNFNFLADRLIRFYPNRNTTGVSTLEIGSEGIIASRNINIVKNNISLRFGLDDNNEYGWIGTIANYGCVLGAGAHANIYMDTNYGTYIGGIFPKEVIGFKSELKNKYKLFVKGGVLSEDFAISPKSSWSDFVFHKNYRLKALPEVEHFISVNKHLPDVPSAKEVAENGYSQHEINKALLQKVEELTLYVIEQQKQIETLKAEKAK